MHHVSARTLRNGLASKPVPLCTPGPNHPYDELEVQADRMRIQRFYEENGYYATKVVLAEGKTQPKKPLARDVVLSVEEGPPTVIGDVKVFGVDGLDDKTRRRLQQYQLGLRRGQVFRHDEYEKFKQTMSREVKNGGYDQAVVEGAVDIGPKSNLATITVTLYPHGANKSDTKTETKAPQETP